ncbi:RHS repeat-associated protein, partial [Microvirgula sp. AG722]|uniref:hypothetical protein n=1 Tax=Microvirgula sp. AG722 TaxID=2183901 RepID=UPI000DC4C496
TQRGDGNYRLQRPCPWYVVGQDENDSYQGESEPEPDPEPEPDSDGLQAPAGNGDTRPEIGMWGECIEWTGPRSQQYHLSGDRRSYHPAWQRFLNMDPYSPVRAGWDNPYTFCKNDPVNERISASARFWNYFGGFLMIITGIAVLIGTAGIAGVFMIGASIMGGLLSIASGATQIAATALMDSDPKASARLSEATMALAYIAGVLLVPPTGGGGISPLRAKFNMRFRGAKLTKTGSGASPLVAKISQKSLSPALTQSAGAAHSSTGAQRLDISLAPGRGFLPDPQVVVLKGIFRIAQ